MPAIYCIDLTVPHHELTALRVSMRVLGTGSTLPGSAVDNQGLLAAVAPYISGGNARLGERIARKLGVHSRHLSRNFNHASGTPRPQDDAPHLAAGALNAALVQAGLNWNSIRFLIGHTTTPHTPLPSNIAWTADLLGYHGPHLELRQACTGFATATLIAASMRCATISPVAIAGSELGSTLFDPRSIASDRAQLLNLMQMGDGAGAIILGELDAPADSRIEFAYYGSDGLGREPGISMPQGGSGAPVASNFGIPHFSHRFDSVREHGLNLLRKALTVCEDAGFHRDTVDWWIPHQANGRMVEVCSRYLQLPAERIVCDADLIGNTGSAAIWVSLDRLRRSGRLRPGNRVAVLGAEASKYMYGGFIYVHGEK